MILRVMDMVGDELQAHDDEAWHLAHLIEITDIKIPISIQLTIYKFAFFLT